MFSISKSKSDPKWINYSYMIRIKGIYVFHDFLVKKLYFKSQMVCVFFYVTYYVIVINQMMLNNKKNHTRSKVDPFVFCFLRARKDSFCIYDLSNYLSNYLPIYLYLYLAIYIYLS